MPAYCLKLERVPGLLDEHKRDLRMYLSKNKKMGAHNVPRKFLPQDLAMAGIVRRHRNTIQYSDY